MDGTESTVVATMLKLKNLWKLPRFFKLYGDVTRQLRSTPGLVWYGRKADFLRLRFYTLSIWESDQAVNEFVKTGDHQTALLAFDGIANREASRFLRWTTTNLDEATWKEATKRLVARGQQ